MIAGGKRLAYAKIPAADIIYAELECQKGVDCGRITSFFLRVMQQPNFTLLLSLKIWIDCLQ